MNRGLRRFLLRWHRRLGVVVALVVVMLVITGVLLNHTEDMALRKKPVQQQWLLTRYGVKLPNIVSFRVNQQYLSLVGATQLFLNNREVAYCESPLRGAVVYDENLIALCRDQLLLLTAEGEVIERLSNAYGLPEGLVGISSDRHDLWLRADRQTYRADLGSLLFVEAAAPAGLVWVKPVTVNAGLRDELVSAYLGNDVSWERVLLDLHSGRLLGHWGVYAVDASAVILLLLALSGAWVWLTKPGRWR